MPSAPQNRACANGRSLDTHNTDRPLAAARSLKVRTLVAQTGVSTDGKIFSKTGLPLNWSLLTGARSDPVRVKDGAVDPTAGSSPTVLMGFPRIVICAMRTVCQGQRRGLGSGLASTATSRSADTGAALRAVVPPLNVLYILASVPEINRRNIMITKG